MLVGPMKPKAPDAAAATARSPANWFLGIFLAALTIISTSAAAEAQTSAAGLKRAQERVTQGTAGVIWPPINAVFVVGDSFSATGPVTDPSANLQKWPVFLSNLLGIVYTQSRNRAEGEAQIETISLDGRIIPGLQDQLRAMPAGQRKSGLLVIWIWTNNPTNIRAALRAGVNTAHSMGFRRLLIPSLFDSSKMPLVRQGKTQAEIDQGSMTLSGINNNLLAFIPRLRRLHPDMKIYTVDVFTKMNDYFATPANYDEYVTNSDGVHPTIVMQNLLAQWFYAAIH
jgi:phospholipase/lecithinase/hemolysin